MLYATAITTTSEITTLNDVNNVVSSSSIASINEIFVTLLMAFILGTFISLTYMFINRKKDSSQNFIVSIAMIPAIISIIILLVGNNVARAFSLAGAFSLIRFRSAPGSSKDITFIFFAMAAGLGCGVGLVWYALALVVSLCLFLIILDLIKFGTQKNRHYILKITVPEDLNFKGAFDDILEEYTVSFETLRIKTVDLGTLYQLYFDVCLKKDTNEKEMIDKLRCRNGNLNIALAVSSNVEIKAL
ncbi:MAG: DUF4956 domain-containing protein [Ruminococcaceae bacterium]|nr:DUF4956 domain-containing protein [Oscillospiraceae bacterium]